MNAKSHLGRIVVRIFVTSLTAVLLIFSATSAAAQEDEPVSISIDPVAPVEVSGDRPVEFEVLLQWHTDRPVDVVVFIEARELELSAPDCRQDEPGFLVCEETVGSSRSFTVTAEATGDRPLYDTYQSAHLWLYQTEEATGKTADEASDWATATLLIPGRSPFRAPEPAPNIQGFVPAVIGRVVDDATGEPVRNAAVELRHEWSGEVDSTHTDDQGRYRFTQSNGGPIPAGRLTVDVSAVGYRDQTAAFTGVADHAARHRTWLESKTPPAAPEESGPPVAFWFAVGTGCLGVLLVVLGLGLVVRRRSARAQFQPLSAVAAVLGEDVHVGAAAAAVAEAAGHQVVTTAAAGEQGPKTSALHVGEAVSTHGRIHSDDEDQIKPVP